MVTLGIVGVGAHGMHILRAAVAAGNVRMAAVCDANTRAAQEAAEYSGAHIVPSLEEMLQDDRIEGIVIIVPNALHRRMVEQALAAGKHVFVDKPIANTLADGVAMLRAAEHAGRIFMVGHNTRRAGGYRAAKHMLDAGEVGTLVAMEAHFSHAGGIGLSPTSWRYRRESCPAVPLIQLGIHAIDTMHYLAGKIARVSAFMRSAVLPENDDVTVMLFECESGVLGTLQSHYVVPGTSFVKLFGTEANLHVEGERLEKTTRQPYGTQAVPVERVDTLREEIAEFARCIEAGERPETDGEGAVAALAVVEAAIRSAQEGRPVSVAEVMERAST